MRTSEHYELNLVEGTDKVNPLVQDVPNYEKIDESMYNNKCSSIGIATELRTGTVHALTRQNEDAPVFRFTASSNYTSGDTFTIDGVQVSALLVDGTPLPNMAYIIGSEVLCVLKGTLMTVFANRTTASDSDKLGGELPSYYATDSDLDTLKDVVEAHTEQITQLNSDLSELEAGEAHAITITGVSSAFIRCHSYGRFTIFNAYITTNSTSITINGLPKALATTYIPLIGMGGALNSKMLLEANETSITRTGLQSGADYSVMCIYESDT